MKKLLIQKLVLLTVLVSPIASAHTGVHTGLFHPLSGVDHFMVVLVIGVISGMAVYFSRK